VRHLLSRLYQPPRCPGTQRIRTAPGEMCGSRGREGHLRATSQNSSKTDCDEPLEGARSLIATSRLSRHTHMSVASLVDGAKRAAFAPLSAADASASKTSELCLSENTLRSILYPYWYVTDPPPVAPSVDSLFELSEKT
jgi:hypothetical protein